MAKFTLLQDIKDTLKSWAVGLRNLSVDNVRGYEWTGTIPAGTEVNITHNLGIIPMRFVVTDARGTANIIRGDTKSTSTAFYVYNPASSSDFIGKILIMP